jgi:hypothetical protein
MSLEDPTSRLSMGSPARLLTQLDSCCREQTPESYAEQQKAAEHPPDLTHTCAFCCVLALDPTCQVVRAAGALDIGVSEVLDEVVTAANRRDARPPIGQHRGLRDDQAPPGLTAALQHPDLPALVSRA